MNLSEQNVKRTNSDNPDFQKLVVLLDSDLKLKDGDDHAFYAQYNKTDAIKHVVIYYQKNRAVGCGAFKEFDSDTVEIKRMFVHPNFRGSGIASTILTELELWAKECNYNSYILETGKNNPNAIALYRKSGYKEIPNYGQYANIKTSICLKKKL